MRGRRVVTPAGMRPAAVHIAEGRIARVSDHDDVPRGAEVVEAGDLVVLPGLVDTHVHVNEPGRTEWEGFETATKAAAAGGVTTLLDMPLNSIPATTTVAALREKIDAATGKTWVDVGFIGGVVPGNAGQLRGLAESGVLAFKCFLVPSGVDEFDHVGEADLLRAMPIIASVERPLMVHAELPGPIADGLRLTEGRDRRSYETYLASRPDAAETDAVAMMIRLGRETGAWVHIVHLSSAESIPLIREAWEDDVAISAETCPHYLYFEAGEIPDGATEYKCAPPIRARAHRDALWKALETGDISMIVTDHSPCPPALKQRETGDWLSAWGGIASVQLGASVVWTEMRRRGIPIERLADWMSLRPATLVGLGGKKGEISEGFDADLVLWDPSIEFVVDPATLYHRHPVTPYAGRTLTGRARATWVRGELAFDLEHGPARTPPGRLLLGEPATV